MVDDALELEVGVEALDVVGQVDLVRQRQGTAHGGVVDGGVPVQAVELSHQRFDLVDVVHGVGRDLVTGEDLARLGDLAGEVF